MRKVIFFDIDGTLVNTMGGVNIITSKVKQALKDLQQKGHMIFIATGRPYAFISQAIKDIGFDGYVLANGAQVIVKDKIIHMNKINKDELMDITKRFRDIGVEYIIEDEEYSYVDKSFNELIDFYHKVGVKDKYIKKEFDINDINGLKVEMLCADKDIGKKCKGIINSFPQFGYYSSIDDICFELYLKQNTKAVGILKVLEYFNLSIEDSFAFGDGQNDIEMLSTVGCGIAMGNAKEEVKNHADFITDSVDNDGVYTGIYKYILK